MNHISRKMMDRRTLLRGVGVAVGLPVLDAMTPAFAERGAAPVTPVRLAFVYVPNGIIMDAFTPGTEGANYETTRVLKPLEALREDLFILSGLRDQNGEAGPDGAGDHARAGASYLTGVRPKKTAGADIRGGISADQVAARFLGQRTRLASLELGCDDSRVVGNCDSGYSCAYSNSISWRTPTTPMPPEVNPRLVFERLFGAFDPSVRPEERARRLMRRKSILDLVHADTRKLVRTLGAADRRKVDEYLTAVRELERRIALAEKEAAPTLPELEKPAGVPVAFGDYVKLMYDLQVLAFRTDSTRISTLMIGREGSNRVYPEIGVPESHHPITHHRNEPEWIEKVTKINVYHAELFAYLLKRLKETPDGNGSLLDHSMIVYGSGLSDGNQHAHSDLPVIVAGRGGGALKPGRHLRFAPGTPMTNLYLTLLDRAGVRPESIGDSTGKVEHLSGV
ncbi:MAG: DUF1552 domain-containing protein [Capsulimonadales bacterium]|nr:DUF1552 domain-containing protein [Capsulimonadales bacterium]